MKEVSAHRLFSLAFLTGLAGLGSETVFFKLFDLTLGSAPLVSFAVVAVFILGMGLGAELSPRVRRPYIAEAVVAVYDLFWIILFDPLSALAGRAVSFWAPVMGVNAVAALLCAIFALPAAILLGISFPAIAERRSHLAWPYAVNALGAAVGVVLVDALLYPRAGLFGCLGFLAAVHLIAAAGLYGGSFRFERLKRAPWVPVLIAAGIATGAFQGVWLFLSELLFQPFYFVQPAVVTTMIAGLFFGSVCWIRFRFSFSRALFFAVLGMSFSVGGVLAVLRVPENESLFSAVVMLVSIVLPAATAIGALVPAYFGARVVTRAEVGAGWLSIAAGNTIGVLFAGAVLLSFLSALWAVFLIALLLAALAVRRERWVLAPLLGIAAGAWSVSDADYIRRIREHEDKVITIEKLFRGPAELSAIYAFDSPRTGTRQRRLYQTGFSPMYLDGSPEALIGTVGSAYAASRSRVLIIGAGSGFSAAAMASIYIECDVVDVGSTVPDLLRALSKENGDLWSRGNVNYHAIDGISAPVALHEKYDLIVMTVDPAFHAKAAKLYTREYFEKLREMLAPGGVFVFWADADLDAEANQILINTGASVFAYQKLFSAFAKSGGREDLSYFFLVHGMNKLEYRPASVRTLAALPATENERLLTGRAHPTTEVHSVLRPAASVVFGGYHRGVVEMQ